MFQKGSDSSVNVDTERLKRQMAINFTNGSRLAPVIGISRTAMYKIIRGDNQPSPDTFRKLCEALNCDPRDLLKEL